MKKTLIAVLIFGILIAITYALSRDALPEATAHTVTITDCEAVTDSELVFDAGDEVTLLVTADQDAHFHIHGYDLMRELTAGMEERIVFQATDPGRYEYELEEICHLGEFAVRAADGTIPETESHDEEDGHDHGAHVTHELMNVPAGEAPSVMLEVLPDPKSGYNARITFTNFTLAPEHASEEHVPGEGHAHIYIDGEKINRVYGEWYHLADLAPGRHEVSVRLSSNDHKELAVDGEPIMATVMVDVPGPEVPQAGHGHDDDHHGE
jgi:hypothetical protein